MQHRYTVPLVEKTRGELVETVHRGVITIVSSDGEIRYSVGNPDFKTFLRSSAKPFQLLPTIESGAIKAYDLQDNEIAVMCSSHGGEEYHLRSVRQILSKIGLDESALDSGIHPPSDLSSHEAMIRKGQKPTAIHSNCSGKHAGILALCQLKGFSTIGYTDQSHPAQQLIKQTLSELAEAELSDADIAIDGCGVPTFALPVWRIGLLFAKFATASTGGTNRQKALARIRDSMIKKPTYVSGSNRFCAKLTRHYPNQLVMKSGAEGVYGLGLAETGLGLGMKIETGVSEPREISILETLRQLSQFDSISMSSYLRQSFGCLSGQKPIYNFHKQNVGRTYPVFQLRSTTPKN